MLCVTLEMVIAPSYIFAFPTSVKSLLRYIKLNNDYEKVFLPSNGIFTVVMGQSSMSHEYTTPSKCWLQIYAAIPSASAVSVVRVTPSGNSTIFTGQVAGGGDTYWTTQVLGLFNRNVKIKVIVGGSPDFTLSVLNI